MKKMQGRTEPRNYRMAAHHRPSVKQITQGEIQEALKQDSELENTINQMDDAIHHCKDRECREEYKIVLSRAILKYGYRNIDEMYR